MFKNWLLSVLFGFYGCCCLAQQQGTIYLFPGQGSDSRIFDSLKIKSSYRLSYIEYDTLLKNQTMESFAKELAEQIDTTENFVLIGVSLGGMLCVELNELINPQKVIIISSAKNRYELPFRYRFQNKVKLYKLFSGEVIHSGAQMLQPIVEPDRNKNKETFKSMLSSKDPDYMKQSVALIMNWERKSTTKPLVHIHGTDDHTLPIRRLNNVNYIIPNGSHMMTLTRAKEISEILNKELIMF